MPRDLFSPEAEFTVIRKRTVIALGLAAGLLSACGVDQEDPKSSDEQGSNISADVKFQIVGFGALGRCLDVVGGDGQFDNGRLVQMWDCYENDNQRWRYDNGRLIGLGGKCLDVLGFNRDNGAAVGMWDCSGGDNQRWSIEGGRIRGYGGKCLDIAGGPGEYDLGRKVQMWDCNYAKNQEWAPRGNTGSPPGGSLIYKNPVFDVDFADPFVLYANGTYFAYATNGNGKNIQAISSNDLVHWSGIWDAMPQNPSWAQPPSGMNWAPAVLERYGRYILYYTTRPKEGGRQCIGRAISNTPNGPFVDDSSAPLICQWDRGGSIDPSPFLAADGTPWITWKNDGNCCGIPVSLWSQRLSDDGLRLEGGATEILRHDQGWEDPLIEGSSMIYVNGRYSLLYSANWYNGPNYAVGAAVCDGPAGPCRKPFNGPIMSRFGAVAGPGGQEFFRDAAGRLMVAYHGFQEPKPSYDSGGWRSLRIDPVVFEDGIARVQGPTAYTQVVLPP